MSLENVSSLDEISTEILLIIFSNLSIPDLISSMQVCVRFYKIINHHWDIIVFKRKMNYIVTNQQSKTIQKRSMRLLTPYEKYRISNNWKIGRYSEDYVYLSKYFIPQFHLERNYIWFGVRDCIRCYQRRGSRIYMDKVKHNLRSFTDQEICKFVVKNDVVVTANESFVRIFPLKRNETGYYARLNDLRLTSIDMDSSLIAVGSREGEVQMLTVSDNYRLSVNKKMQYKDLIWCIALQYDKLAIGTASNNSRTCINIVDTVRGQTVQEFSSDSRGKGILQLKWQNSNVVWSGGYDGYLRRWDLRMGQCVQEFLDPCGSKVNCFDCDFVNTAITGCDYNRATLWDLRQSKYVQLYFMNSSQLTWSKSPVHSISFDAEFLFASTDTYMNMFNFSVGGGYVQDYSQVYVKQIVI